MTNLISSIILDIILVIFPILIYFIYSCYNSLSNNQKYNNLILTICLISSSYLILYYGHNNNIMLFVNIPLIISYLKNKPILSIGLSIMFIYLGSNTYNFNIYLLIIKYLLFYLTYYMYINKQNNDYKYINLTSIIESFFTSFMYYSKYKLVSISNILELFILVYIFFLIPFFILYLFKITDKITSLYMSSLELERDKQLKNSLFKITHEVKNPIAVCKGYLDMIDINDKNKLKKYIPVLKDEINRSLNIMTDFMEFSKIKLDKDILDINMLISEVSHEMKIICGNKITLNYQENDEEIYINGDYGRLKQVLINMIKNSIESIENTGTINVSSYVKNNNYYIEIKDTGIGMDKETLNKISEMFFTTKVRGSGLGVSLSKEIIKAHSGNIKYQSTLNKGTKVTIKLPIYSC